MLGEERWNAEGDPQVAAWETSSSNLSEDEAEGGEGAAQEVTWAEMMARRRASVRERAGGELLGRELGTVRRVSCDEAWRRNAPHGLVERQLPCAFNKVFAQTWLDEERFLTGSKDNSLALWTVSSRAPASPAYALLRLPAPVKPLPETHGGIHSLALSQDRALLASGSGNPNEVALLSTADWSPMAVCVGHRDWVFGSTWVAEGVLWTASRDKTLRVWRVPHERPDARLLPAVLSPGATLKHHSDRVRALTYAAGPRVVASLGSDRRLALWSPDSGALIRSTATRDHEDLIALECDARHGLFAVGGRDYVSFFDARTEGIVRSVQTCNRGMGVRSLCFRGDLLSVGGGLGRLSFFDLVAGRFHRFAGAEGLATRSFRQVTSPPAAAAGEGSDEPQAVYVHRWDDAGARMFVGGGPLLLQTNGGHASLW